MAQANGFRQSQPKKKAWMPGPPQRARHQGGGFYTWNFPTEDPDKPPPPTTYDFPRDNKPYDLSDLAKVIDAIVIYMSGRDKQHDWIHRNSDKKADPYDAHVYADAKAKLKLQHLQGTRHYYDGGLARHADVVTIDGKKVNAWFIGRYGAFALVGQYIVVNGYKVHLRLRRCQFESPKKNKAIDVEIDEQDAGFPADALEIIKSALARHTKRFNEFCEQAKAEEAEYKRKLNAKEEARRKKEEREQAEQNALLRSETWTEAAAAEIETELRRLAGDKWRSSGGGVSIAGHFMYLIDITGKRVVFHNPRYEYRNDWRATYAIAPDMTLSKRKNKWLTNKEMDEVRFAPLQLAIKRYNAWVRAGFQNKPKKAATAAKRPKKTTPSNTPTNRPANRPASRPANTPVNKPASRPLSRPASHPANKPASRPANRSAHMAATAIQSAWRGKKARNLMARSRTARPNRPANNQPANRPANNRSTSAKRSANRPANKPAKRPTKRAANGGIAEYSTRGREALAAMAAKGLSVTDDVRRRIQGIGAGGVPPTEPDKAAVRRLEKRAGISPSTKK